MTRNLEEFVRVHLPAARVEPLVRNRGSSRVLCVSDENGDSWYAKQLTRQERFDAEVRAFRHWGHLPFVPILRATDAQTRCLLVRGLPGDPPRWHSRRVLRRAGERLRELHHGSAGEEWPDDWRRELGRDMNHHLKALEADSVPVPVRLIRRTLHELQALDALPLAITHGDYHPYNWRVRSRDLYVFDFGQAALRPAVHDLTRLRYSVCWERPHLLDAVLAGYGRPLNEAERRYLKLSLVVRAVIGLNRGRRRSRPIMVEHARRVLRHVRRQQQATG